MKLNSKDIIIARDNICKTKTKYWRIIRSENVMTKKAKLAGMGSGFDLTQLYNQITQMSDTLIKLMLNAINNGTKKFNFEDAKKTHYYTILVGEIAILQRLHFRNHFYIIIDNQRVIFFITFCKRLAILHFCTFIRNSSHFSGHLDKSGISGKAVGAWCENSSACILQRDIIPLPLSRRCGVFFNGRISGGSANIDRKATLF